VQYVYTGCSYVQYVCTGCSYVYVLLSMGRSNVRDYCIYGEAVRAFVNNCGLFVSTGCFVRAMLAVFDFSGTYCSIRCGVWGVVHYEV
jgi:hypothetical protein